MIIMSSLFLSLRVVRDCFSSFSGQSRDAKCSSNPGRSQSDKVYIDCGHNRSKKKHQLLMKVRLSYSDSRLDMNDENSHVLSCSSTNACSWEDFQVKHVTLTKLSLASKSSKADTSSLLILNPPTMIVS